jgi:hypothetical protein
MMLAQMQVPTPIKLRIKSLIKAPMTTPTPKQATMTQTQASS